MALENYGQDYKSRALCSGILNPVTGKGTIRETLKEQYSGWEEAKADILGL